MKFLICGLGSIGKRHLENLLKLGIDSRDLGVMRRQESNALGDKFLEKYPSIVVFHNLAEALDKKPKAIFITNPTALHIKVALKAAKSGCHLFLEKPISHSLAGVAELIKIVKEKKLTTFVAYNFRFHPLLRQVKKWLDQGKIGRVISVQAELAEWLIDWHPWEDYKISYASRADLGGGVVLTQCHELDYLYWMFGQPEWIFATGGKIGDLRIDVEAVADSLIKFPGNITASLHLDYYKKPAKRFLEISGTKGRIFWNFFSGQAELVDFDGKTTTVKEPANFERNQMYLDELKHFLACLKTNKKSLIDICQGKEVLEMALATKKSMREKKIIYLK